MLSRCLLQFINVLAEFFLPDYTVPSDCPKSASLSLEALVSLDIRLIGCPATSDPNKHDFVDYLAFFAVVTRMGAMLFPAFCILS